MTLLPAILFYLFAATAVVLALGVITARNPIYSAISLVGCLFAVAGIFALQSAQLMAVLQILVYAGAIMVLILFVIMLLNLSPGELGNAKINAGKITGFYLLSTLAALLIVRLSARVVAYEPSVGDAYGSIQAVGMVLFTDYLLPFEMVSILLLAAIIGAVILTRKEKGQGS